MAEVPSGGMIQHISSACMPRGTRSPEWLNRHGAFTEECLLSLLRTLIAHLLIIPGLMMLRGSLLGSRTLIAENCGNNRLKYFMQHAIVNLLLLGISQRYPKPCYILINKSHTEETCQPCNQNS